MGALYAARCCASEGQQLIRRRRAARLHDHVGHHQHLVLFDLFPDRSAVRHGRMRFQHAFDLIRRNAIAETLDDVVAPPQEPDIPVFIVTRVVAGEEETVMPQLGRFLGQVPVIQKQTWIVVRHADHSLLARRYRLQSLRVQQLDLVPGLGKSRGAGAYRPRFGLAQIVGKLRHADRLVDIHAETFAPLGQYFIRQMLTRTHAVAQAGNIRFGEIALLHDLAINGRHTDKDSRRMLLDQARPGVGVVLAFMHDHRLAQV